MDMRDIIAIVEAERESIPTGFGVVKAVRGEGASRIRIGQMYVGSDDPLWLGANQSDLREYGPNFYLCALRNGLRVADLTDKRSDAVAAVGERFWRAVGPMSDGTLWHDKGLEASVIRFLLGEGGYDAVRLYDSTDDGDVFVSLAVARPQENVFVAERLA